MDQSPSPGSGGLNWQQQQQQQRGGGRSNWYSPQYYRKPGPSDYSPNSPRYSNYNNNWRGRGRGSPHRSPSPYHHHSPRQSHNYNYSPRPNNLYRSFDDTSPSPSPSDADGDGGAQALGHNHQYSSPRSSSNHTPNRPTDGDDFDPAKWVHPGMWEDPWASLMPTAYHVKTTTSDINLSCSPISICVPNPDEIDIDLDEPEPLEDPIPLITSEDAKSEINSTIPENANNTGKVQGNENDVEDS